MGHSLNILGLRSGRSYKWKIFFISTHLVNYYYDHTIFFYFMYKYLIYLFRYKYAKIMSKGGLLFSHLNIDVVKTIKVKIYLYNKFWLSLEKKLKKVFFIFTKQKVKSYKKKFLYLKKIKRKLNRKRSTRRFNKYIDLFANIFLKVKKRRPKNYKIIRRVYNQFKRIRKRALSFNYFVRRRKKVLKPFLFNFSFIFRRKNARRRFVDKRTFLEFSFKTKKNIKKYKNYDLFKLSYKIKERLFILYFILKTLLVKIFLVYIKKLNNLNLNSKLFVFKQLKNLIFGKLKKILLNQVYFMYKNKYNKLLSFHKNIKLKLMTKDVFRYYLLKKLKLKKKNKLLYLVLLIKKLKIYYKKLKNIKYKRRKQYRLLYKIKHLYYKKFKKLKVIIKKRLKKQKVVSLFNFNSFERINKSNKKVIYLFLCFLNKKVKMRKNKRLKVVKRLKFLKKLIRNTLKKNKKIKPFRSITKSKLKHKFKLKQKLKKNLSVKIINKFKLKQYLKKILSVKLINKVKYLYKYFVVKRYNKTLQKINKNERLNLVKKKKISIKSYFKRKVFKLFYKKLFIYTKEGKVHLNGIFLSFLIYLFYKKKKNKYKKLIFKKLKNTGLLTKAKKRILNYFYYFYFLMLNNLIKLKKEVFLKSMFYLFKRLYKYLKKMTSIKKIKIFYLRLHFSFYNFIKMKISYVLINLYKVKEKNKKIHIKIYPIHRMYFSPNVLLTYWKWKMKKRFTINSLFYPYLRRKLLLNYYITGFAFKGFGRFTRRQRASAIKTTYGQIGYSTYKFAVTYFFYTIRTKYGTCSIRFWYNINKSRLTNKLNKNFIKINIL